MSFRPSASLLSSASSPYVLLFLTMLFWSGNAVIGRGIVGTVPPVGLAFWRWTVALAVLLPFGFGPLWAARRSLLMAWPVVMAQSVLGARRWDWEAPRVVSPWASCAVIFRQRKSCTSTMAIS